MARWGSVITVTKVECSMEDRNEWSQWQYVGMLTERMGGISIIGGGKEVTSGEEIDRGDRVGKEELLDGRVCSGSQSSVHSVERG